MLETGEGLLEVGTVVDPRLAQIERLKAENQMLRERVASRDTAIEELTEFKATAISRLAAQHAEILRLRKLATARPDNVRVLPSRGDSSL